MSTAENDLSAWEDHLGEELKKAISNHGSRAGDFDMDDSPEFAWLSDLALLRDGLKHLETDLLPLWRDADASAKKYLFRHRCLAKTTILCGTSSIVFAIVQMAVSDQMLSLHSFAVALEVLAVVAGATAVLIGVLTKGDRKWLCERNRAERLRVLKFKSLGWEELLDRNLTAWKNRLNRALVHLRKPLSEKDVQEWNKREHTNPELPAVKNGSDWNRTLASLEFYYRIKRLSFQIHYFEKRSEQHHAASRPWRHLSVPVFLISTACIFLHFITGWILHGSSHLPESTARFLEIVEPSSLTFGIIVPVLGLGARVWLGAFEPHRSANLFACKCRTVRSLLRRMTVTKNREGLSEQIAEAEWFLENEHREWLRLMFETEWLM